MICHAMMQVAVGSLCKVQLIQYFTKIQKQIEDSTFQCRSETIQYLDLEHYILVLRQKKKEKRTSKISFIAKGKKKN